VTIKLPNGAILPADFPTWRNCIEVLCNTPLTPAFVEHRITELRNAGDRGTKRFRELYGADHHERVLGWFLQVQEQKLWAANV
jgi:hypothetical protein